MTLHDHPCYFTAYIGEIEAGVKLVLTQIKKVALFVYLGSWMMIHPSIHFLPLIRCWMAGAAA